MSDDLARDMTQLARVVKKGEDARQQLTRLIVEATDAGMPQVQICAAAGLTRERIRQIVIAARRQAGRD